MPIPQPNLVPVKPELITDHPERWQGSVTRSIHRNGATVEVEFGHNGMAPVLFSSLFSQCDAGNSRFRAEETLRSRSVQGGCVVRVRRR